jgi:hypothetical protein
MKNAKILVFNSGKDAVCILLDSSIYQRIGVVNCLEVPIRNRIFKPFNPSSRFEYSWLADADTIIRVSGGKVIVEKDRIARFYDFANVGITLDEFTQLFGRELKKIYLALLKTHTNLKYVKNK